MGYTLHISGSSPIQNPLSWRISDPVQSKSAWTGLDYESSGRWRNTVSGRGLTLARKPCFATFAGVGGGGVGATPPSRFQTKRRRSSRKRPADFSRRVLAIGGIIFGPRCWVIRHYLHSCLSAPLIYLGGGTGRATDLLPRAPDRPGPPGRCRYPRQSLSELRVVWACAERRWQSTERHYS